MQHGMSPFKGIVETVELYIWSCIIVVYSTYITSKTFERPCTVNNNMILDILLECCMHNIYTCT